MVRKKVSRSRKSNYRGSLLGRSSSSSKDKTGFYLVSIVAVVAVVALFLMFSGNGLSILGDDSALVGEAKSLPRSDIGYGSFELAKSTKRTSPKTSGYIEDTLYPKTFYAAIDSNSLTSDNLLLVNIFEEMINVHEHTIEDAALLFNEVTDINLEKKILIIIYFGEAVIIVGKDLDLSSVDGDGNIAGVLLVNSILTLKSLSIDFSVVFSSDVNNDDLISLF